MYWLTKPNNLHKTSGDSALKETEIHCCMDLQNHFAKKTAPSKFFPPDLFQNEKRAKCCTCHPKTIMMVSIFLTMKAMMMMTLPCDVED